MADAKPLTVSDILVVRNGAQYIAEALMLSALRGSIDRKAREAEHQGTENDG